MARAMSRVTRVGSSHSGPAAKTDVGAKMSRDAMGTAEGIPESGCGFVVTDVCFSCIDAKWRKRDTLGLQRGIKFAKRFITNPSEVDVTRSTSDKARWQNDNLTKFVSVSGAKQKQR